TGVLLSREGTGGRRALALRHGQGATAAWRRPQRWVEDRGGRDREVVSRGRLAPMKRRIVFICGSMNQATQMHRHGSALGLRASGGGGANSRDTGCHPTRRG